MTTAFGLQGHYSQTKRVRIYKWTNPEEQIPTTAGPVRAVDWMAAEAERIRKSPGRTAQLVSNREGYCSVEVNRFQFHTKAIRKAHHKSTLNPNDRRYK